MDARRWVLATGNTGKLKEIQRYLRPHGVALVAQSELGIVGAEESGASFVENAILKARHATEASGLPALADDSGLCVNALGGAPGVLSARFAGPAGDAGANNSKLLASMAGVTDRRAHFYCALVWMASADDPVPRIFEGFWYGEILTLPRGSGGFGYDPLFLAPALGRSAAQLDPDEKSSLSHRGQALARLVQTLPA